MVSSSCCGISTAKTSGDSPTSIWRNTKGIKCRKPCTNGHHKKIILKQCPCAKENEGRRSNAGTRRTKLHPCHQKDRCQVTWKQQNIARWIGCCGCCQCPFGILRIRSIYAKNLSAWCALAETTTEERWWNHHSYRWIHLRWTSTICNENQWFVGRGRYRA